MMALVVFADGSKKIVSPDEGEMIWKVLSGESEPNKSQAKLVAAVKDVFLNWRNESTPDSYIRAKFELIRSEALRHWTIDPATKQPVRPEPTDPIAIDFNKKWGPLNRRNVQQAFTG